MNWEEDVSKIARDIMAELGDFGPTIHVGNAEVKGYINGDKTYWNSRELQEMADAFTEVAEWLDKRAEEQP